MNIKFHNLFSKWIWYYYVAWACYVGNLGSITSSIVVRVEPFESVYQDNRLELDSQMSLFYKSKFLCNHIIYQYAMSSKIR